MLKQIISTGHNGACEATLAAAFEQGFEIRGESTKDFKVGGGLNKKVKFLGIKETEETSIKEMEKLNVRKSDGILYFTSNVDSELDDYIVDLVKSYRHSHPILKINIDNMPSQRVFVSFINDQNVNKLFVTGGIEKDNIKFQKIRKYMLKEFSDLNWEYQYNANRCGAKK